MRELVVGTRNSRLAKIQTEKVIDRLRQAGVTVPIRVKGIVSKGDEKSEASLLELGGGIFLEGIESELVNGDIDVAVHSLKDMPPILPDGLHIASIPEREDIRDAYLANNHVPFDDLPAGATIGTCSVRRAAQLHRMRPDIQTTSIRGPIDSRIKQMQSGEYDAIILAVSGVKRLGEGLDVITEYLPAEYYVPAIGQAALAIESRSDDSEINELLQWINDPDGAKSVQTERIFLSYFPDSETDPIAGYATVLDGHITFLGIVVSIDGTNLIRHIATGTVPRDVAQDMYEQLMDKGAGAVIQRVKEALGKK